MRARILSASAGSGKTYRLAYKYILDTLKYYKEKPYLYRAILAVTFTNKATEEMKHRILLRYAELASNPTQSEYYADLCRDLPLPAQEYALRANTILKKILHDYSHFTILTIDKFFQRIMRAFVKELGVDVNYNLQIKPDEIVVKGTDALIESMAQDEDLQRWILSYAREYLDDDKHWSALRNSLITLGNDAVGEKAKDALQSNITKHELEAIISSTERKSDLAQQQMADLGAKALDIINNAGVSLDDFSRKSTGFISIFAKAKSKEIKEITKTQRACAESGDGWVRKGVINGATAIVPSLVPILKQICDIFDRNKELWATLDILKKKFRSFALLKDIYTKIKEVCRSENIMLISETKNLLAELINDSDAPFIYEKTGNRFERYMIDEFQDTSLREWHNFIPLLLNALSTAEDEAVFIVGDVKQSIYRWRGGDWRILHSGVEEALGKENTTTQILEDNWRSRECIVQFNNEQISNLVTAINSQLNQELDEAIRLNQLSSETHAQLYDTLKNAYIGCRQNPRKRGDKQGYVRIERYPEQPDIISAIEDAISRGYSYNDIMILHRGSKDIIETANILLSYKREHGAQFNIKTKDSLVVGNSDIANFVIALLRLSQNNNDKISLAVMNQFLSRSYHTQLSDEELSILSYIGQLSTEQAFEKIVCTFSLSERHNDIAYLQALHEQITAYCATKSSDIQFFLDEWDNTLKDKSLVVEENDTTIELTTIHTAKGLERKIILIPFCSWEFASERHNTTLWAPLNQGTSTEEYSALDFFPVAFKRSISESAFSDVYYRERIYSYVDSMNLLYVALTRAVDELYIYIPDKKRSEQNVGDTLWALINGTNSDTTLYEFGERTAKQIKSASQALTENIILNDYPTTDEVIAMRLPLQRYFEDVDSDTTSARNMGILVHSILSAAYNTEDVYKAIEEAYLSGKLSDEQKQQIEHIIRKELMRQEAQEWFSDKWDAIHNEHDIIHSEQTTIGLSRPDRVMIKGKRAVIVDYKFGSERQNAHRQQIMRYAELMRRMGYEQVEGYIWYLSRGEIQRVE